MTHNAQNTTTTDIRQAIAQAVKIANFRYSVSGQSLFLDLAKSYGQTKKAYNLPRIAEELTALQAQHNHLVELAEELNKTAKRTTAPQSIRTEARRAEKALKAQITALNAQIDDLHKKLSATLPDLADLVQSAMIQQWLNTVTPADIPPAVLAVYGVDDPDDLDDNDRAEAQQRANHRATKQAINRTIASLASPQPIQKDAITKKPITAEEAEAFITTYGEGAKVYIQSKGNRLTDRFDTVEYNQKAKQWERKSHYKAPVNYSYFTVYEDDEGNTTTSIDLLKSYNPFTNSLQDEIDLQALMHNCTANEFVFVEAYTDRTAGQRAIKARSDYYKTAPTPTREGADTAEHNARITHAWEQLGMTNPNTQRSFMHRFKNRLVKACDNIRAEKGLPPVQITANAVKRLINNHSEPQPTTQPTVWKPCKLANPAPIIAWLNAQEAEQARADHRARARAEAERAEAIHPTTDTARAIAKHIEEQAEVERLEREYAAWRAEENKRAEARAKQRAEAERAEQSRANQAYIDKCNAVEARATQRKKEREEAEQKATEARREAYNIHVRRLRRKASRCTAKEWQKVINSEAFHRWSEATKAKVWTE